MPSWNHVHHDFPNYLVSAQMVVQGEDLTLLYDDAWFNQRIKEAGIEEEGKFTPFPPITSFLMTPLAMLNPIHAKRIWVAVNLGLLILHLVLIRKLANTTWIRSAVIIFLLGAGMANNFLNGQVYLLISTLVFLAYWHYQRKSFGWAGILLAFAAIIKYLPIIFLAVLLIARNWRLVTAATLTLVALALLQLFYFGIDLNLQYLGILQAHLGGEISGQHGFLYQFQSWNSLFSRLFVFDESLNPQPLLNAPWLKSVLLAVIYSCMLWTFYKLWRLFGKENIEVILALVGIGVITLLPASATYHCILLLFPITLLIGHGKALEGKLGLFWLTSYGAMGFIPYGLFWNEAFPTVFLYPRLWLLILFFVLSLVIVSSNTGQKPKTAKV